MANPIPLTTPHSPIDVLVIGAGPAALSFGTAISRLLHTSIFFSSPRHPTRNAKAGHMHTLTTWDHQSPSDFRDAGRKELAGPGGRYETNWFVDVGILSVAKQEGLFRAVDESGKEWWGRKLVLATGVSDVMAGIEGFEECWVKGM